MLINNNADILVHIRRVWEKTAFQIIYITTNN